MRSGLLLGLLGLIWPLLSSAEAPLAGRYGEHLTIAYDSDKQGPLLIGLYDRSVPGGRCRFQLYGRPQAPEWRLLLVGQSVPARADRLLGRLRADGERIWLDLPRAPRGCEAIHPQLTSSPEFSLSEGGDWLAAADLAPAGPDPADASFWQRPLPGLSAPATLDQRQRWHAWLDWSDACENRFSAQRQNDEGGLNLVSFGSHGALLRIACGYYAYQESFIYAWLPAGRLERSRLLVLPGFDPDHGDRTLSSDHSELIGLDEMDRNRGELRIFHKYRGAGDCGQWLLFDIGESGPELRQWRERDCEADPPESEELPPPELWPVRAVS